MFTTLSKKQIIRLNNTLLAAAGGLVLTGILVLSFKRGAIVVSGTALASLMELFWLGNLLFIGSILTQINLRFKDPALSLAQMYWAAFVSMGAVVISLNMEAAVYSLILLTMLFGVFRVSVKAFYIYCLFVILGMATVHAFRVWGIESVESTLALWAGWFTFGFCSIGLTLLCKSIVKLRNRLREQNEELKNALQAKSYFLANMSHEIRTPMNGVLGMLDITLRGDLQSEQRQYISVAQSSAHALLGVINDILDFSKIEAGKLTLEPLPTNISKLVTEVVAVFAAPAEQKGVELIVDIAPDIPPCFLLDPTRTRQILNNLLGNAMKFTEAGEVVVSLTAAAGNDDVWRLYLSVQDSGIGIATEKCEDLFESFTQADVSTTRTYGGTGLGLTITKQLCELMGGSISVVSELGQGSTFTVDISASLSAQCEEPEVLDVDFTGKTILLVDDNYTNRLVLRKQLEFRGACIFEADSAFSALSLLQEKGHYIDLAILDLQMPKMDGLMLAHTIREEPKWDAMKLMMLTSIVLECGVEQLKTLRIGANLNKPIMPEQLYKTINNIFSGIESNTAVHSHAQAGGILSSRSDGKSNGMNLREKYNILLVEDNITNQQVALISLGDLGYQADVAEHGKEAIEKLIQAYEDNSAYHLLLMDCQMPVMDGYQATRAIRQLKQEGLARTPIVAMTAHAMEGDREKCLDAGMNDYMTKPINIEILRHTVKFWLENPEAQSGYLADDSEWDYLMEEQSQKKQSQIDQSHPEQAEPEQAGIEQEPQEICWDRAALFTLVRYKKDRMIRLIEFFLVDLSSAWEGIYQAKTEHNFDQMHNLLHSLKGSSSNLGARSLPYLIKQMEHILGAKDAQLEPNIQGLELLMPKLEQEIQSLIDEMQAFLAYPIIE